MDKIHWLSERASQNDALFVLFRDFQRTERPVVPVIVGIVVVDVRKASVVRVATVQAVRSALEIMLISIFDTNP